MSSPPRYVPRPKAIFVLDRWAFDNIYPPAIYLAIDRLTEVGGVVTAQELLSNFSLLAEVEIIFGGWGMPQLDEALLAHAPRLQAVFYGGGTIRRLVSRAFWQRGILIVSGSEQNAIPVAEYTVAAIILSLKQVWRYSLGMQRTGRYLKKQGVIPGAFQRQVGIIGAGSIGRRVIRRLREYDLTTKVWDPFLDATEARTLGVELMELDQIFASSDVVSLHLAALPETTGLLKQQHFASMPKDATFINTARGIIVDEAGLIAVMESRPDLTALLDVTHPEPPLPGSRLLSLPNILLTPHIAGAMDGECARMGQEMLKALGDYLKGARPNGVITEDSLDRIA